MEKLTHFKIVSLIFEQLSEKNSVTIWYLSQICADLNKISFYVNKLKIVWQFDIDNTKKIDIRH